MKFLFINLSIDCGYFGVNHGIAYLVPIIKRHGYEVSCINLIQEIPESELQAEVRQHSPDIVGFSSTSHQLKFLASYSKAVAACSDAMQIAGGVASTLDPEWILTNTAVHGVCVGEGEIPLEELLARLGDGRSVLDTPGFWWSAKQNEDCLSPVPPHPSPCVASHGPQTADCRLQTLSKAKTCVPRRNEMKADNLQPATCNLQPRHNPPPPFITDLSSLSFPDYSIFDRKTVLGAINHTFVMLSRGCPYNCFYCCNRALACAYENRHGYFRLPSVDYAIRLVKNIVKNYPETQVIEFEDDLLIANKEWFLEFAERYRAEIALPYRACVRVECVTPEIVKALKVSGCQRVLLGLESGNEEFRKKFLNRMYSNDLLVEKCRMLRKAGLDLFTFNIVGFPTETPDQMRDTLRLNKRANPSGGVCTFFYPYKHTRLHEIAGEHGLLKSEEELKNITNYNTCPGVKMPPEVERECLRTQKEITGFLEHQRLLWRVEQLPIHLPRPLKRFISPAWWNSILTKTPILKNFIKHAYHKTGLAGLLRMMLRIK